jgi:hypothetical protein
MMSATEAARRIGEALQPLIERLHTAGELVEFVMPG